MDRHTPPSIDDLAALRESAHEVIDTAIEFITKIDSTIFLIDDLMHVIQPFQTGRIGVKFFKNRGKIRIYARMYRRIKGNVFYSTHISFKGLRKRVKRAREFEHNHKLMQTLCDYVTTLMQLRVDMCERIANLDLGVTNTVKARSKQVDNMVDLISSMHATLQQRFNGEMVIEGEEDDTGLPDE